MTTLLKKISATTLAVLLIAATGLSVTAATATSSQTEASAISESISEADRSTNATNPAADDDKIPAVIDPVDTTGTTPGNPDTGIPLAPFAAAALAAGSVPIILATRKGKK